jgi:hypothetical protein
MKKAVSRWSSTVHARILGPPTDTDPQPDGLERETDEMWSAVLVLLWLELVTP